MLIKDVEKGLRRKERKMERKLSVKLQNKERLSLKRSDAEAIFMAAIIYELALYAKRFVSEQYKDLYTANKRIISNIQAKQIAEMALGLLLSDEYTDIEYAVDDSYKELGCPCTTYREIMTEPTYVVADGNEMLFISYEDMQAVENLVLTIKFREVLKRTNPEIIQGNKAYHICRQAISLIREGCFSDIEFALEEVVDRVDTFNYKNHPLLKAFDAEMQLADDNYEKKIGLATA